MIYGRDRWQARHGRGRTMRPGAKSLVVIHHAASPNIACGVGRQTEMEVVRSIETYHAETRGWAGIGYSFLVFQSGNVYEGRGWGRVGAHTRGKNATAYGVCLVIDGTSTRPTLAALESVRDLIAEGVLHGHIAEDYRIGAHRMYGTTECPGDHVMAALHEMGPVAQ